MNDVMKKIELDSPESQSANLLAGNIAQLKALFPELITEGPNGTAVNVDVLKALVGDATVADADEKYGLNWHGKRRARQLALAPSTGTLRPCPEESVEWDTTKNLMIEGDNLEVLKLLQKSYAGKVKLIYIDPPYNTGKDFVYPDNFQDNIRNYLELTGQIEGGQKISSNTEASGRFHTDWLNMMYPRLKLARTLLRDDGAIFISIDDGEVASLRTICAEIFGEENFVANVVWQKKFSPQANAVGFSDSHDHIIVFAKDKSVWNPELLARSDETDARYENIDNDPRGPWTSGDFTISLTGGQRGAQFAKTGKSPNIYEITTPSGRKLLPPKGRCWGTTPDKFDALVADNRIWFGESGSNVPRIKRFLSEVQSGIVPMTWWPHSDCGHNQEAKQELNAALGDAAGSFDTPKPIRLLKKILEIGTRKDEDAIVLDFFAGSGTTAHAVMIQNAQDSGRRRFILVQLPEPVHPDSPARRAGFAKISDITRRRLSSATATIRADKPLLSGDLGFRVFKLDFSNIRAWNPKPQDVEQAVIDYQDNLVDGRTEVDVLYELLLKLGLDLCVPIEQRDIAGKKVHSVGGGVLITCLASTITREEVESLAQGIVAWQEELAPAADTTCVFRDSAFVDDVAKTNLAAILEQHGIQNVRSL